MKIAIIATEGRSLKNFRGELIKEWRKRGHEVVAASVEPEEEMERVLAGLGVRYARVPGDRTGTNFFRDMKMLLSYLAFFRREKPGACFLYMSKPVAYGGIAARAAGVPGIYGMISGLEIAFYKNDGKNRFIRKILIWLYRLALKKANRVFFQNPDDRKIFLDRRIVRRDQCVLVHGSGVDMNHFTRRPMPDGDVFLMVGRLVRYKGIYDFVEAAEIVKKKYPRAKFRVLGGMDTNSDAMTEAELDGLVRRGIIEYLGFVEDVREALSECSVFVLPSRFEGVPRSALEAMASGRPIITANAPGCRETVENQENGFLVECGDIRGLAEKMILMIENHALRDQMAGKSYDLCVRKFDVVKVNRCILAGMGLE